MKKITVILLVTIVLIGCNDKRILIDELINKGTEELPLMYYQGKLFNGIGYDIYRNGQLRLEGEINDGKYEGKWKEWRATGELWVEHPFKNSMRDGKIKSWHQNGQLAWEGYIEKAKYVGLHKRWYENGQLKSERNWKDDKWKGLCKTYYQNGQLKSQGSYKGIYANSSSNNKVGMWKYYHEDGREDTSY